MQGQQLAAQLLWSSGVTAASAISEIRPLREANIVRNDHTSVLLNNILTNTIKSHTSVSLRNKLTNTIKFHTSVSLCNKLTVTIKYRSTL